MLMTCKEGDCRHLEGNLRASKRVQMVDSLLEEIGLGKGRLRVVRLTEKGIGNAKREIDQFRAAIRNLEVMNSETSKKACPLRNKDRSL